MRKFMIPLLLVFLASCAQFPPVKDRDVPTAFFVFFDENSAQTVDGSDKILDEVAGFLKFYGDLTVNIVGQRAESETSDATDETIDATDETIDATDETIDATDETIDATDETIDAQRANFVAAQLQTRGVAAERMSVGSKGVSESMASAAGGDESVDRRVDIIIRIVSGQ
jgi:outer membrane protein OmpA-like peptidoglycan-associated protein